MSRNRDVIEDWHPSLKRLGRNDKPHACHAERSEASRIFIHFTKTRSFGLPQDDIPIQSSREGLE